MFSKQCKAHLEEVGETGLQHMGKALKIAVTLQLLVPVVLVHAVAPRFFTKTASTVMKDIVKDRNKT
jgi:hypothetical protein